MRHRASRAQADPARASTVWRGLRLAILCNVLVGVLMARHAFHPLDHQAWSPDFVSFWAASHLADLGHAASAYTPAALRALEEATLGPGIRYQFFLYPPVFLLPLAPFGMLPLRGALLAFDLIGIVGLCVVLRQILDLRGAALAAVLLATGPCWWAASLGQTSFLVTALFAGGLLLLERGRPVAAGFLLAGLAIKPHLALMVPVALVAARSFRCLAAGAVGGAILAIATTLSFGTGIWASYLTTFAASGALYETGRVAAFCALVSPYGIARMLGAPHTQGMIVQGLAMVVVAITVFTIWRPGTPPRIRNAVLLAAAPIAAPIALYYELVLLVPAILWLVAEGRETGYPPGAVSVLGLCLALATFGWAGRLLGAPFEGAVPLLVLGLGIFWAEHARARLRNETLTIPDVLPP